MRVEGATAGFWRWRTVRLDSLIFPAAILLSATAADASVRRDFDIPGGRLGDALVVLGRQAGISVGVTDPALASRRVGPVRGRMTVDRALARLLDGTGGRSVAVDLRTWRVERAPPRPRLFQAVRRAPPPQPLAPVEMGGQPDIVITASKRSFRLASFPGAVMFVDPDDPAVAAYGRGTEGLTARLPGLNSTHLGTGRNKLFIRGIADSSFNGPTQATVGQYLGETRLNYNTPDPNLRLHDVERVEVLPGPQGTLYGAGSLGGILRIVPNAPRLDEFGGSLSARASLTQHGEPGGELAGMLNLPVVEDTVGLRVVGYGVREGGYIDDTLRDREDVNRTQIYGGRARLRAVTGSWTIDLGVAGQRIRGDDGQFADRDAPPLTRASPITENYSNDYLLSDIVVQRDWDDGMRFVSTAAIVRQDLDERYDATVLDGPVQAYDQSNDLTFLTAESRLSRSNVDGTGWLIGTSFISNRSELTRALGDPDAPSPIPGVRNKVNEITGFGEATFALAPRLYGTVGARLTHTRLSGSAINPTVEFLSTLRGLRAQRDETVFLPSLALSWRARDNLLLFARYQEGFRPGGVGVTSPFIARIVNGEIVSSPISGPTVSFTTVSRFENDHVATIEVGARYGRPGADSFDLAVSASYTRWTDIQADVVNMAGFQSTSNIGDGRIFTLDFRAGWRPLPGLNLEAAAVLNDSLVTNPELNIIITPRASLPNVARFNGYLGADYVIEFDAETALSLWSSARYAGRSRLGIGPILGELQGDWLDIGTGARLTHGRHAFSLSLTNLTDEVGNRFAMGSPFTLVTRRQVTPLRPRTLSVGWELRF